MSLPFFCIFCCAVLCCHHEYWFSSRLLVWFSSSFFHHAQLCQVEGLAKGVAYHVRVSAYNGVALSYGKTVPAGPPIVRPGETPEPPSRIEVEAASPSSLAISWSPPNDAMGADIIAYQVVSEKKRSGMPEQFVSSKAQVHADMRSIFFFSLFYINRYIIVARKLKNLH